MLVINVKLGQRIAIRMAEVGIKTYSELAKRMGSVVTPTSISRWIADTEFPKGRYLKALAKALEFTVDELLGVEPTQEWEDKNAPPIYIISFAEAGEGKDFDDMGYPVWGGYDSIPRPKELVDMNAYGLTVRGDSMSPAIEEGWLVIVAPNYQVKNKDFVIVRDKSDNVKLKKIQFSGEVIQLYSVNSSYAPEIYQKRDLKFIHKVWAIIPR
jgi:phage repressor protein C with HTH and peptisase S24 domain